MILMSKVSQSRSGSQYSRAAPQQRGRAERSQPAPPVVSAENDLATEPKVLLHSPGLIF